jgi:flavorubredoxin
MHNFLHHLQIKSYQNRRVGIIENGSWAPSAGRVMRSMLEPMKGVEILSPSVTILSRMKEQDQHALEALADALVG